MIASGRFWVTYCHRATSRLYHQQRSDNVPAWSGQPHTADLSKNSPSMLLSATSEALARLRVSDLTAAAPCGSPLFEHTGFCKQGGPILDTCQARQVSGSWRMAAGRRRSARSRSSEGLCPSRSRKPRSDQHQECSTTDNHGYHRLDGAAGNMPAPAVIVCYHRKVAKLRSTGTNLERC